MEVEDMEKKEMKKEKMIENEKVENVKEDANKEKKEKGKEKDLEKIIDEQSKKIEELENQLKEFENYARILKSQFENYKKDVAREKEQISISTIGRIVEKLVPIIDDFKRAFKNVDDETKKTQFFKGMEIIYKNLFKILEGLGLQEIKVGDKFDPFEHEAVERVEDEENEEYSIVEIVEDGYKFNGRVLKPVKVKVSIKPRR
jgi:molecular chaperone GrpE